MITLFSQEIPYQLTAEQLFERIRHLSRPILLDSSFESNGTQRFDIMSAAPASIITADETKTTIYADGLSPVNKDESPFSVLKEELAKLKKVDSGGIELPFHGGALGYFSYDLGRTIEALPTTAEDDISMPLMDLGIYLWAVIRDNELEKSWFIAHPQCPENQRLAMIALITDAVPPHQDNFKLTSNFSSNMSVSAYKEKYHRIIDYIKAGDCYQVNLAQRFKASYEGDEWFAYQRLSKKTDAPFSAYMQTDDYALVSLSPERFIEVNNGIVETKPIKGTRPRGSNPEVDKQNAELLKNSTKDRAENLMIVDLLRNDISKACELGSVKVPKLFDIEGYSNVHHMVSTIQGKLANDKDAIDLLEGSFPGGSITGAPKLRAMEIIEELEPHRRTAYCGSIAYLDCNGNMDSSILIRTLVCRKRNIYCWGGGGIVADSDADKEYTETLVKVSHLMEGLA